MNNFFNYSNLRQIHVELTNACNAACPCCPRFYSNSPLTRPDLQINQITLEKFKKYFDVDLIKQLHTFMFCGVIGDPGMAKDLYEICEYALSCNSHIHILIHTNGGMRKPEFWGRLGSLFKGTNCRVTFSVDGLEDTNHLYRRQVSWPVLFANMTAYLNAGGNAEWDFLIFRHNEHQVVEAKQLSKQLGFRKFNLKKALGFEWEDGLKTVPVITREGKKEYSIFPPINKNFRNLENPKSENIVELHQEFRVDEYYEWKKDKKSIFNFDEQIVNAYSLLEEQYDDKFDDKSLTCKSKKSNGHIEVFVDSDGTIAPCCYVGTQINSTLFDPISLQLHYELNKYGWEKFNLEKYSIKEILEAGHLDRVFSDSWSKPSCQSGKLAYCVNTCGDNNQLDRIHFKKDGKDLPT